MDIRLRPRCTIIAPPTTRPILITLLVHPLLGFTRHPLLYHVSTSSYRLQDRCAGLPLSARSCAAVLVGLLPARRGHEPSSSPVVIVIISGCQTKTRLSTVGDRAFPVIGSRFWNTLPVSVTSAPSLAVFRSRLKSHTYSY